MNSDVCEISPPSSLWLPWRPVEGESLYFTRGEGYRVYDSNERPYIDCNSGALNAICGFGRDDLALAATKQMARLSNYDMSVAANEPAMELSSRLQHLLPSPLASIFFANSGSEANEAAIRMCLDYWTNRGEPKTRIISFAPGYHGTTALTQHLSGLPLLKHPYHAPLPVTRVELPALGEAVRSRAGLQTLLDSFEKALSNESAGRAAGVVVEPFLNVGGGVRLPDGFLRGLRSLCDKYEALLIVDEVFTGMGRSGRMFAVEHENVTPDIMTISKGMTGGYVPLSAVAATETIHESFRGQYPLAGLRYGHTTSGHATACAVALEVLNIMEREAIVSNARQQGEALLERLRPLTCLDHVQDVRGLGLIAVVEMTDQRAAALVLQRARELGVILRSQGASVMAAPPLVIDTSGISQMTFVIQESVKGIQ
ncbi:aspartate aminotransferase family protein [Dermacoccus nishinomiyaensis]|uniref:aminotransferase family protein n=1 Tax=Dermacoccus nishinomiyaensis TaxID=1274 RepID=UPI0010AC08A7|nr:aminotransferase class III-fold pyridoxal phosphate-dependent enzyme [Dermacoccus nishinomiyaensis]TJZ94879.1 aspartate aminotransferase family protein [Dermacoccus nishinomiyaensis]